MGPCFGLLWCLCVCVCVCERERERERIIVTYALDLPRRVNEIRNKYEQEFTLTSHYYVLQTSNVQTQYSKCVGE
jgi:hypothetical protein